MMRNLRSLRAGLFAIAAGFGLTGLSGCQTWVGGMTLPSGYYLRHTPQYFSPDPTFPLPRELASMEDPAGAAARAGGVGFGGGAAPVAPGVPTASPVAPGGGPGAGPMAPGGAVTGM